MNIIIVDDNTIFREGLKLFLEIELGHSIIAEASNGKEFLGLPNIHKADIILMDIDMPEMNGIKASKLILERFFHLKIIAITMHQNKSYLLDLVQTGIKGFIPKSDSFKDLDKILTTVYENEYCFPADLKIMNI